jgi:hypothetical protein
MACLDPQYYHRLLEPRLVGPGYAADVFKGGELESVAFMAPIGGYTGQLWRFSPAADGAWRLSTLFRGPAFAATTEDDGTIRLARAGGPAAEWIVEPLDGPPGLAGRFPRSVTVRLTTRLRGPGWSLDVALGGELWQPTLAERADRPGQVWLLAQTEALVG